MSECFPRQEQTRSCGVFICSGGTKDWGEPRVPNPHRLLPMSCVPYARRKDVNQWCGSTNSRYGAVLPPRRISSEVNIAGSEQNDNHMPFSSVVFEDLYPSVCYDVVVDSVRSPRGTIFSGLVLSEPRLRPLFPLPTCPLAGIYDPHAWDARLR